MLRLILACGLLLAGFALQIAGAQALALVDAETLTLRKTAEKSGASLGTLTTYEPVTLLKRDGDWAQVKTGDGKTGFVLARYLTKVGFVSVTLDKTNVRRGPGTEYAVIMNYGRNFPLRVLDVASNGWLKVLDFDGDRGWLSPKTVQAKPTYVITKLPKTNVRKDVGPDKELVYTAEKGVILEVLGEREGWLNVKHADGDVGWLSAKTVFGWLDVDDPSPAQEKATAADKTAPAADPGDDDKADAPAKATTPKSTKSSSKKSSKKSD